MNSVDRKFVNIKGGYLFSKQEINRRITIDAVYDRFFETKRVEAFKCVKDENRQWQPHHFWDSDVAKWIEGASYIIAKTPDKVLEEKIESIIDDIEANQWEDGYINSYYTVMAPEKRFTDVNMHELYCAGHLVEAAIAYFEATGKDRFLKLMIKYIDLIYKVFCVDKSAAFAVPGHEEIELALYKLYKCTGNEKYLEMCHFFVEQRGVDKKGENGYEIRTQSDKPITEQNAEGHSVRAMYLYSALADLGAEGFEKWGTEAERLFEDVVKGKMYITGGLGQIYEYEGFADKYYLPNERAYAETCAGIGLMFFCHRMLKIANNSKYADVLELAFYNNVLSGLSLSGDSFFYRNPLSVNIDDTKRKKEFSLQTRTTELERVKVFGCSCCPPNLNRVLASLEDYIFYTDADTVFINQFATANMSVEGMSIEMVANYPADGRITVKCNGVKKLAIRIPGWCEKYEISAEYTVKDGYAYIENPADELTIEFDMTPKMVFSDSRVKNNVGKCCVMCGPVVYCGEGVDNGTVHNLFVPVDAQMTAEYNEKYGLNEIALAGEKLVTNGEVYSAKKPEFVKTKVKLIPYSCFANRGASDMRVWLNCKF